MELIIGAIMVIIGFVVGGARERKHLEDIKKREAALLTRLPTRSVQGKKLEAGEVFLVTGNVVVASDQFKNFVGALKNFFGGNMSQQEILMDRARREAILRAREAAVKLGAREIVDLHIECNFLDQMGVEVSAYATAVRV
jgi:uncharacterized protein YbjQ (UPF0145 family)